MLESFQQGVHWAAWVGLHLGCRRLEVTYIYTLQVLFLYVIVLHCCSQKYDAQMSSIKTISLPKHGHPSSTDKMERQVNCEAIRVFIVLWILSQNKNIFYFFMYGLCSFTTRLRMLCPCVRVFSNNLDYFRRKIYHHSSSKQFFTQTGSLHFKLIPKSYHLQRTSRQDIKFLNKTLYFSYSYHLDCVLSNSTAINFVVKL